MSFDLLLATLALFLLFGSDSEILAQNDNIETEWQGQGEVPIWASFERSEGFIIPASAAIETKIPSTECSCREACLKLEICQDYSFFVDGDVGTCSLGERPRSTFAEKLVGGIIALHPAGNGRFIGYDGNIYWSPMYTLNFQKSQEECNTKSDFALGTYKTLLGYWTIQAFRARSNKDNVWVNMKYQEYDDDSYATWKDGTRFRDTELANYPSTIVCDRCSTNQAFRLNDKDKFSDMYESVEYWLLCQRVTGYSSN